MPDVPLISKIVGTYVLAVGAGGVVGSLSLVYRTFLRSDRSLTTHLYIETESTNVLMKKVRI